MKTIGIDIGHNCSPDTGAVGVKKEDELVMEVGKLAIALLKEKGINVVQCKPNKASTVRESLQTRVAIANKNKVDLYCSLHFNAFNCTAHGTEVFAISPGGKAVAASVLSKIVALGYANRGVKGGKHLYVVRATDAPAILVEFSFCDSQKDMDKYDPKALANAFVSGVLDAPLLAKTSFLIDSIKDDNEFPILQANHASGELIEKLQSYFNLPTDGFFDSKLEVCVKSKQSVLELPVNGYVDEIFWRRIFD